MNFPARLLQIKKGEGDRVFRVFLCVFFLISSLVVGKTARDTFFLSRFDPAYLPHMFILVAVVIAVTITIHTRTASRFTLLPTTLVTLTAAAASLLVIQVLLNFSFIYPLLYVWMEVIGTVMMIQFWLLANSAFTSREAKRLFGIIGSGGAVASVIVGFSIRSFVRTYGTDYLLVIAACFVCAGILSVYSLRPFVRDESTVPEQRQSGSPMQKKTKRRSHPLRSPYLRTMTLTITISALVASLVDYQFKITASSTLDEGDMASLFGMLYGVIGVASIVMQFFVTGRVLSHFGILWGLMFLPAALVTGNALLLFTPAITSAVLAKAGDQIFRFSIHDASTQLLWLPVSQNAKRRTKPFIDGTMRNSAQAISGLLIIGMVKFLDVRFLSVPALLLLVIWIVANTRLKRGYVAELHNALEKRRLDFESLEIDITDPSIVNTLKKTLVEGKEHQTLFALDMMKELPLSPWATELQELLHSGPPAVQKRILELTRRNNDIVSDDEVLKLATSDADEIATEAMIICGEREISKGLGILENSLSSPSAKRRAGAAAGLLLAGKEDISEARRVLDGMLYDPDNKTQIAALQSVGHFPRIVTDDTLGTILKDDSQEVRRLATDLAADRRDPDLVSLLVDNLEDPVTALRARRALKSYNPRIVESALLERLKRRETSNRLTMGIVRVLGDYAEGIGIDGLIEAAQSADSSVVNESVDALVKVSRRTSLSQVQMTHIDKILENTLRTAYGHLAVLKQFQNDNKAFLIEDFLSSTIEMDKTRILKLSLLPFPESPVETFLYTLRSRDPKKRAGTLEILDNLLPLRKREQILPLFDDSSLEENVKKGYRILQVDSMSKEKVLMEWIRSRRPWPSAIAFDYILSNNLTSTLVDDSRASPIEWGDEQFIIQEVAMYSVLERTIFMKGVDLFRKMPGEEVSHVAQIAEEARLTPDESVFREGDPGDSMFIIVDGRVRIHKSEEPSGGEKEIAVLSEGEFMGEMALLDQEPRSASATAIDETVVLRIKGEDFYDLMASRMVIMQGIVKVLTGRLRKAIA